MSFSEDFRFLVLQLYHSMPLDTTWTHPGVEPVRGTKQFYKKRDDENKKYVLDLKLILLCNVIYLEIITRFILRYTFFFPWQNSFPKI